MTGVQTCALPILFIVKIKTKRDMKNIFIALFIIIITASCTSHSGYTFTGEVPEAWEGKQVELILSDISVPFVSDSAVIRNGRFVMKGNVDIPRYAQVAIYLDPEDKFNRSLTYRFPVFIENSNIVVTCDNSNIKPVFNVEGSAAHEEYKLYNEFIRPLEEDRKEKFREYGKVYYQQRDLEKGVELAKDVNYRLDKIKEARLQFVKDNPESSVSLHILRESWKNSTEMSVDEMSVLVDLLSDNLRQSVAGADFMNSLSSKKMIVGKPHPNVEQIGRASCRERVCQYV